MPPTNGAYREALREKAVIQAEKFSWEKSAEMVLAIYKQVITMPKFGALEKKEESPLKNV